MAVWLVSSARCAVHGCDLDKASKAFSARRVWANPVFFLKSGGGLNFRCFSVVLFHVFLLEKRSCEGLGNILGISGSILCRRLCAAGVRCAAWGAKEPEFLHESRYPLVNCYITLENHHFQWVNPLFRLGHFQ